MTKTLYVLEAAGGGTKKALYLLVTNINREEFDITLALPPPADYDPLHPLADPQFAELMRAKGYNVETVKMVRRKTTPIANLLALLTLYSIIRRNKYEIVHTYSTIAGFVGRLAAKLAGVPVVIHTPEGLPFNEQVIWWKRWLFTALERFLGSFTDALIACSEAEQQQATAAGILEPDKIVVIKNCIDTENFDVDKIDGLAKKRALGLGPDDPVVGMVARLSFQKGPRYFIEAAAQVLKVMPEAHFLLVGDGELREEVQMLIEELSISDSVDLLGYRDDCVEIMATFDVFVLSSLWEGLPYAPREAMLLRKPVVMTAVSGVEEIIQDNSMGVIVPEKDSRALAEAILRLLQNKEEARRMGRRAEESIRQRFGIKGPVSQVTQLYRDLLTKKESHGLSHGG